MLSFFDGYQLVSNEFYYSELLTFSDIKKMAKEKKVEPVDYARKYFVPVGQDDRGKMYYVAK